MSATAGENKVNLRWADPGDSSISNYEIRQKEGSGTFSIWEGIEGSSATTRSHEVTGLTNDTTYTFEVRAIGDGGQSEASSVSATPASGEAAPGAMVNLQAVVSGVSGGNGGKVRFTWDNPNDISIDKYQFRYSSISTFEGFKDWADVPSSSATTVSYPTGAGTIFIHGTSGPVFYELRAVNDPSGDEVFPGPAAAIQVTRENSPGTSTNPPGAPGALDPEISPLQVVLKWTAPTTGTVSSYQYRQKEGNGNFGDWMGISGSSSSTTSYTVSGLTDGTSYTFEVRAVDNNGTTNDDSDDLFGAAAAFGPVTPGPRQPNPPILHLSPSTSTSITELDWTAVDPPAGVTVAKYQHRSRKDGHLWQDKWRDITDHPPYNSGTGGPITDPLATECLVTGLAAGTTHYHQVRAVSDSSAPSVPSNTVSERTADLTEAPPPPDRSDGRRGPQPGDAQVG